MLLKLKYQANRGKSKQCRAANVKCCKLHGLADRLTALLCLNQDRRQQDKRTTGDTRTDEQTHREEKGPAEDEDRGPSPEIDWLADFVNEENVEFAVENRSQLLLLLQLATHTVRGQFHWGQTDTDGDAVGLADENGRPVTFSAILLRQPRRSTTQKLRHKLKTKFSNFCSLRV